MRACAHARRRRAGGHGCELVVCVFGLQFALATLSLMASEFCVPKLAFFSLRASPLPLGSTGTAPRDAIGCDGRITASRMRAMGLGSAPTRHSPAEPCDAREPGARAEPLGLEPLTLVVRALHLRTRHAPRVVCAAHCAPHDCPAHA